MAIVLENYGIAYFPIPKVACSSLKTALYELAFGKPFVREDAGKSIHQIFPTKPFSRREFQRLTGHFKFAVIRDPIDRILSAYSNKIADQDNLTILNRSIRVKLAEALVRFSRIDAKAYRSLEAKPHVDFFVKNIDLYNAKYPLIYGHTRPTSYYLGNDLSQFDRIYTISELPTLQKDISEIVGRDWEVKRENVSGSRSKASVADLSEEGFQALMNYLRADYGLLADYFEAPPDFESRY